MGNFLKRAQPASVAELLNSKWDSAGEPDQFASEMEIDITVQLNATHNYGFRVCCHDTTVEDVLVNILGSDRVGRAPEPRLFFNDQELQKQKTLADCGIKHSCVLHLKCTPRVLARNYDPTKIAKKGHAESSSSMRPSGDGEMKIYVRSEDHGNFALEVDKSNTIMDVLSTLLREWFGVIGFDGQLSFNGHPLLETAKSLADYSIEDGSILHLEVFKLHICLTMTAERGRIIPKKKRIKITDQPLAIWEKEHDKIFLSLLVEQISNRGEENILHGGEDSWCNIVAKFNESTGLQYEYKHLCERFNFYRREYHIVNHIRHHPKFSWDHKRHVVIATNAEWNKYIKQNPDAKPYRKRAIPYVDLLGILFANAKV